MFSRKKAKKKKAAKKVAKKSAKRVAKKTAKKKYTHHPDHYNTSEEFLVQNLDEDLKDAWFAIRTFGESLGEQRIYASGRAIVFSRGVCYFFVRPKPKYLEVVIMLREKKSDGDFKIQTVSKTKHAHTFRLIHSDQIEGLLEESISEAYNSV